MRSHGFYTVVLPTLIQLFKPISWLTRRPGDALEVQVSMPAQPRATPRPVLGSGDQPGPTCVGFDVTSDRPKVGAWLDWKTLEPALVEVPAAACVVVLVMSPHMRHADPSHQTTQRVILRRIQQQMPVSGHHTVRVQLDRISLQSLSQHMQERKIVSILPEDRSPKVGAIDAMIWTPCFDLTRRSRNDDILPRMNPLTMSSDPFFCRPFSAAPFLPPKPTTH
jgi:hypothetical protein